MGRRIDFQQRLKIRQRFHRVLTKVWPAAFFAADELVPYILSKVFDTFIWEKHVLAEIPTYKTARTDVSEPRMIN